MEWIDEGIVLSARPHGETSVVATLLTREHGRHAGLVHASKLRGALQPGNLLSVKWRARLAEHLGTYTVEPMRSFAAGLLDDQARLATLQSACAISAVVAPEREPHPDLFEALRHLLGALETPEWIHVYIGWELGMLRAVGFGLDLQRCAATGGNDDLAYVSPRTGRAVSLSAGEAYRDRLLPLPGFLIGRPGVDEEQEVIDGLNLTGHFLERHVFGATHAPLPEARLRMVEAYRKLHTRSGTTAP